MGSGYERYKSVWEVDTPPAHPCLWNLLTQDALTNTLFKIPTAQRPCCIQMCLLDCLEMEITLSVPAFRCGFELALRIRGHFCCRGVSTSACTRAADAPRRLPCLPLCLSVSEGGERGYSPEQMQRLHRPLSEELSEQQDSQETPSPLQSGSTGQNFSAIKNPRLFPLAR